MFLTPSFLELLGDDRERGKMKRKGRPHAFPPISQPFSSCSFFYLGFLGICVYS